MSDNVFPYGWCALQITVLAGATLLFTRRVVLKRPECAARRLDWAALLALIATVLCPIRMPSTLLAYATSPRSDFGQKEVFEQASHFQNNTTPNKFNTGLHVGVSQLLSILKRIRSSGTSYGWHAEPYVVLIIVGVASVQLAWMTIGFWQLSRLRRRATPIVDPGVLHLAAAMISELHCRRSVTFAESADIATAAVVGWRHPTVLFARDWEQWSRDELRAAMAHELSHVCRHDVLWRTIASVCAMVHWYNPLVHWLRRRLVLAQELTADRSALSILGGRTAYLRALSSLALRQDGRSSVRPQPFFTSVFSGHWLRRIEMLRAMDCSQRTSTKHRSSSVLTIGCVVFCVVTTVVRGLAQTGEDEPIERVASRSTPGTTAELTTKANSSIHGFRFSVEPSSHPVFSEKGALFLDVSALRSLAVWGTLQAMIDKNVSAVGIPALDMQSVDAIHSDLNMRLYLLEGDQKEKHGLSFGFSGLVLRVIRDVHWEAGFKNIFPEATESEFAGTQVIETLVPALGPHPARFFVLNSRELAMVSTQPESDADTDSARTILGALKADRNAHAEPSWDSDWKAVSGGLLTFAFKVPELDSEAFFQVGSDPFNLQEREANELLSNVYKNIERISIGLDSTDDGRAVLIKFRVRCLKDADGQKTKDSLQEFFRLSANLDKQTSHEEKTREIDAAQTAFLEELATIELSLIDDSTDAIEGLLSLPIPLVDIFGGL